MRVGYFTAVLVMAIGTGCSDSANTAAEQSDPSHAGGAVAGPDAQTFDMADYGYSDGQVVTAIEMPDWMPIEISLPEDFVPVEKKAIGTRTYLLRGITRRPSDNLYDTLSADMLEAGFKVRDGDGYQADNLIYFEGNGYVDSTIKINPGDSDTLLEISLSKSN